MSTGSTASGRRRQKSRSHRAAVPEESALATRLTQLTDISLVTTVAAVVGCFGGRTPIGQLVFAGLSVLTALIWSLRQCLAKAPAWRATHTVWIWSAGALIAVLQTLPFSEGWIHSISPEHGKLLALWTNGPDGVFPAWTTLSFDPAETTSGLVTFLCYGLVFLVAAQRLQNEDDVERVLKAVGLLGIAFAVFGLAQFFLSNGEFFWVYQHPVVTTNDTVLSTFTNRNHTAQFLAMTVGPVLWWLTDSVRKPAQEVVGFGGTSPNHRRLTAGLLAGGLAAMLLAGLLTLSRGGSAALALALLTALVLLHRRSHLPAGTLPIVLGVACVAGGGIAATSSSALTDRFDNYIADERTVIWAANVRLAQRFPWLGTGVGTHLVAHQLETDRIDDGREFTHAESGYLQVASECGLAGLAVAAMMILMCLNWCRRAYRADAGERSTAAAAVIFASLIANLLHAGVDFFWFTPGCMLVIVLLAACACRLSQLAAIKAGGAEPLKPRARIAWAGAICGLAATAAWMTAIKLPGALAEPHRVAWLNLKYHGNDDRVDDESDQQELERMMLLELLAAAKANPRDCRAQIGAASGLLRMFGLKQEDSESGLSLDQLRDIVRRSEFESVETMNAWLEPTIGDNLKYLKWARSYARRALKNCPLEGNAYLLLAQLEFLRDPASLREERLQEQARAVRPFDAGIDFEIGKAASWKDNDAALAAWKRAFRRSPNYRREITAALVEKFSAEQLIEIFEPDWLGLWALLSVYQAADKEDDLLFLREKYAEASMARAQSQTGHPSEYAWCEAVRVYREAEDLERAIAAAETALEQHSQSIDLHKMLGQMLGEVEDFGGAAKHLSWAAQRLPDDGALQKLAAEAVKQKLRHENAAHDRKKARL